MEAHLLSVRDEELLEEAHMRASAGDLFGTDLDALPALLDADCRVAFQAAMDDDDDEDDEPVDSEIGAVLDALSTQGAHASAALVFQ